MSESPSQQPSARADSSIAHAIETQAGVAAAGRDIVERVGRIAPGLRCGVVTAYGPTGAWRVLAEADLARSVERLAAGALPRLVAAHEDVLALDERSWALPLVPADGRLRGCIVLLSDHARVLPPDSIARLTALARTAAESLEEARRAQVIALAERQEAALRGLPRLMLAATGRDEVLEIFGSTVAYALPDAEWRVLIRRASDGPLTLLAARPDDAGSEIASVRLAQQAIRLDRVVVGFPERGRFLGLDARLMISAPVHDQRMRRIGAVVIAASVDSGVENDDEAEIIGSLCGTLSLALELDLRSRTARTLQRLDPDTGCTSTEVLRELTAAACDRTLRENGTAALLAIQLESGSWTPSSGDATRIGRVLGGIGREYDTEVVVSRIRPWQFALLADRVSRRDATLLAARVRWHLKSVLPGLAESSSCVGIAMIPQHGTTFGLLMDAASAALDEALTEGNCERMAPMTDRRPPELEASMDRGARLAMLESTAELIDQLYFRGLPHSEAVSQRARAVALRLGVPADLLQYVTLAGKLHDVGRALLAPSLFALEAPSPQERRLIQAHVVLGGRLVANAGFPKAASCIASLHERWDGTGEPHGLRHTDIPLGARIVATVNTFETVLHGLGRGDHGAAAAIDTLRRERDRGLDPTIVDCLFSTLRDATASPAASDGATARSA
jgi:hypothetical protein